MSPGIKTLVDRSSSEGIRAGGRTGSPSREDDVAADAEGWRGARNFDGLIGGRGASHERGAGQHARLVKFEDGAVNSRGLAKVVSVDDETGHWFDADTDCAFPK